MITAAQGGKAAPGRDRRRGRYPQVDRAAREDGTLVRRGRELLEREIGCFSVIEHDGVIVRCAALYPSRRPAPASSLLAVASRLPGRRLWRTPAAEIETQDAPAS